MEKIRIAIDGMSCGHCVATVERALKELGGVSSDAVRVGEADVSYDALRTDSATILAAVSDAGFPAHLAPGSR